MLLPDNQAPSYPWNTHTHSPNKIKTDKPKLLQNTGSHTRESSKCLEPLSFSSDEGLCWFALLCIPLTMDCNRSTEPWSMAHIQWDLTVTWHKGRLISNTGSRSTQSLPQRWSIMTYDLTLKLFSSEKGFLESGTKRRTGWRHGSVQKNTAALPEDQGSLQPCVILTPEASCGHEDSRHAGKTPIYIKIIVFKREVDSTIFTSPLVKATPKMVLIQTPFSEN